MNSIQQFNIHVQSQASELSGYIRREDQIMKKLDLNKLAETPIE